MVMINLVSELFCIILMIMFVFTAGPPFNSTRADGSLVFGFLKPNQAEYFAKVNNFADNLVPDGIMQNEIEFVSKSMETTLSDLSSSLLDKPEDLQNYPVALSGDFQLAAVAMVRCLNFVSA